MKEPNGARKKKNFCVCMSKREREKSEKYRSSATRLLIYFRVLDALSSFSLVVFLFWSTSRFREHLFPTQVKYIYFFLFATLISSVWGFVWLSSVNYFWKWLDCQRGINFRDRFVNRKTFFSLTHDVLSQQFIFCWRFIVWIQIRAD